MRAAKIDRMMPRTPIEPEGIFDGLSGAAILLGAFIDIAFTEIACTLLILWLAPDIASQDEAQARKVLAALAASTNYIAANLSLGALGTIVGAFVGARRAGQLHVRHGGWIAVASTALGALLMALEPPAPDGTDFPMWAQIVSWILILPAGMSGGALAAAFRAAPHHREP
jgi:hypothetical protein